ncbi:MAG: NAD(P)/FAD-dependent oxidoreductase [Verrucomicrobia bacterium]|nr:NAD(P)/FAD-dependent oxidoreductase [Verrucomicrobiota bacterium]
MKQDFDIAVVGSGFGGSLIAMIARRLGRSVILLERGKHPRFAIGESSTPLANLLLEELGVRYDLPALSSLSKWGAWQKAHPEVAGGLKRGFTFYHHHWDEPFADDAARQRQLLIAASPRDEIADTHWYRADFDHFLARQAQAVGAEYLDEAVLHNLTFDSAGVTVNGKRSGRELSLRAKFLIDATGPRGFVHRALNLPELAFDHLPRTEGLYSHFTNVRRWDAVHPSADAPPYPVDDAALHHVFDGGWIWVLRFNNGITSAGVAATESLARKLRFEDGAAAWERFLQRLPSVKEQFRAAQAVLDFVHAPRLSFRSSVAAGPRWALLPSAAGFIDPLLSTGFALTLLGISRLAQSIEHDWESDRFEPGLNAYATDTFAELLAAERLVAALYASMKDFGIFSRLSLLYFGAVSYAETARRLGRKELADSFLLHKHSRFGPRLAQCCDWVARAAQKGRFTDEEKEELQRKVVDAIAPLDSAGLCDTARRNWYPVRAEDLLEAAPKFGVGIAEIKSLLRRNGFAVSEFS